MIQKLRRQFILVAMGSTLAVLIVIIGTLNILNYHVMTSRKDDILEILSSNNGEFPEAFGQKRNFEDAPPEPPENGFGPGKKQDFRGDLKRKNFSRETAYETRFFSVTLEAPKRSKTHILRVEFPDGTVLQDKNVSETYARAIKLIDPDLVALVNLSHAGVGVVSKTLDSRYAQYQKPIGDGWYVMTNSSTNTKCNDLQTISDELELDLKVYLVPLDGSEITVLPHVEIPEGTRAKIRVTFPEGRVIFPAKVLEALILHLAMRSLASPSATVGYAIHVLTRELNLPRFPRFRIDLV